MNEKDLFLSDVKEEETDAFAHLETTEETPEEKKDEDDPEAQPESVKDRRHRRLEEKLREEREANIALAERLKVIAETKTEAGETEGFLKSVERIYGTDSPEALTATELLKESLKGMKEEAVKTAVEQMREEMRQQQEAVKKEEETLDSMLEELEDEFNIDLTSKTAENTRKAFFTELQRLSPKDSNGSIIAYADHRAVFESLQAKAKKPENRAKDLAARSMTQSGATKDSTLVDDVSLRWLKENDMI